MAAQKKGSTATKGGQGQSGAKDGQKEPTSSTAGLEVTAIHAGFRRAGLAWSNKPTRVKVDDLTDEQVALLKACPGLTVTEIDLADANEQGEQA